MLDGYLDIPMRDNVALNLRPKIPSQAGNGLITYVFAGRGYQLSHPKSLHPLGITAEQNLMYPRATRRGSSVRSANRSRRTSRRNLIPREGLCLARALISQSTMRT